MSNSKVNLKWALILLMIVLGPFSQSQTNRYLTELGKSYKANVLNDWSKKNEGVLLSKDSDERYVGIALPQYGVVYDHDFNKINKIATVTAIAFGKANTLRSIFSITEEDKFKDARQELPFGLKMGMAKSDVERITGKILTIKHSELPNVQQAFFSNLPGFRHLDLTLWFENEQLTYLVITTDRNGANSYQRRLEEIDHPMKMSLKNAITEKSRTNRKLPYNYFFKGIDFIINGKLVVETMGLSTEDARKLLSNETGADSVIQLKNQGYRAVWCTADILDKESFFDEFLMYMNIALDSGFRNNGYPGRLIADYQSTEVSNSEYYYYSYEDNDGYLTSSQKPVFHLYQVKESNEVVLDMHSPSDGRTKPSEPSYIGVCAPEDPDLELSDDEFLNKYNIDLPALQVKYKKHKGNALLRILDKEWSYPEGASQAGLDISFGYNEKTTEKWLKRLEIAFDKEFSRSVYKGDLPFGLKRGMSIWKIKNVFPGSDYKKWHAKKDWFTTYQSVKISENLDFDITMSFRRGKLARLVIQLDELEANSRAWQVLKSRIFPQIER